jgi:hypothetical protein
MKKNIFYLLSLISIVGYSQNKIQQTTDLDKVFKSNLNFKSTPKKSQYYIADSDTVFCSHLTYKLTAQSYLSEINYVDSDNKEVTIKGNKNMPNVSTFFINGESIDKIPQKTNKPDKYIKWASRVVDGKLIVNYYYNQMTTYNNYDFNRSGVANSSITKFFIKMPNGIFYDINDSSDRNKYIIPYLKECDAFTSSYKGDYSKDYDSFIETIKLYNLVCK